MNRWGTELHRVLSEDRFLCHLVVTGRENHDRRSFLILPQCCAVTLRPFHACQAENHESKVS